MTEDEKMVRVPEAMYRQLEKRAMRATELEEMLLIAGDVLRPYKIFAVITRPPSGDDALSVLTAVQALVAFATKLEDK